MNKKLLLIPITLMSCFMGACTYDVKHVGINEILDYSLDSTGYFFIYGLGNDYDTYNDYEHAVANIIRNNIGEVGAGKKADGLSDVGNGRQMEYRFQTSTTHNRMYYFTIYIYEDGTMDTYAGGSSFSFVGPKDQYTTYKISEESATKIIDKTIERKEECDAIILADRARAKEYATFENFFNEFNKKENSRIYYREKEYAPRSQPHNLEHIIEDKDGDILEDIMGLEYQDQEEYTYVSGTSTISLFIDTNWQLHIDYTNGHGYMYYAFDATITEVDCIEKYFTVNKEKLDTLNDKLLKIIKSTNE